VKIPANPPQPAKAPANPLPVLPPNAPAWARPEAGTWKYLADLEALEVKEGPWRFAHDGTLGDPQMRPIYVGGFASPKGLAMHPPDAGYSAVKYRLAGNAATLKAAVALDDTVIFTQDTATFEVWGDGQKLWESEPLREKGQAHDCTVDVAGVETLELRVNARGSHFGLHAVWLEPRVLVGAPK
jgi:hypothetical protein